MARCMSHELNRIQLAGWLEQQGRDTLVPMAAVGHKNPLDMLWGQVAPDEATQTEETWTNPCGQMHWGHEQNQAHSISLEHAGSQSVSGIGGEGDGDGEGIGGEDDGNGEGIGGDGDGDGEGINGEGDGDGEGIGGEGNGDRE